MDAGLNVMHEVKVAVQASRAMKKFRGIREYYPFFAVSTVTGFANCPDSGLIRGETTLEFHSWPCLY